GAARGDFIQQRQFAAGLIDRESADGAAALTLVVCDLIHGVEETAVRVHSHKRRIDGLSHHAERSHLCRVGIKAIAVDSLAPGGFWLRVSANVDQVLMFCWRSGRCAEDEHNEYQQRDDARSLANYRLHCVALVGTI